MADVLWSLRTRVLLGSILWTLGLLTLVSVLAIHGLTASPGAHLVVFALALYYPAPVAFVAIVFLAAGFWQVRQGLVALNELRARLAAVHEGREAQLGGRYPTEVQPLVDDLNTLLAHREQAVRRALAKAGDLAHGLKTPLAVLSQEAERAAAAGYGDVAASVGQQVERMRRHVDYHLAHARAAAAGATVGARCTVDESAQALSRTLLQLHAERGLSITVRVAPGHTVRCQREDLDEMLGNLLDNACKWAKSAVQVESTAIAGAVVIAVEDDGPGLAGGMEEAVLRRGVRADEAVPGSGLGLAIVRDLAELYGGSITLGRSRLGGARAELRLPAAD